MVWIPEDMCGCILGHHVSACQDVTRCMRMLLGYYWKAMDTQYLERSRCARHYTYVSIYTYIYTMEVSVWMQGYCLDAGDTM